MLLIIDANCATQALGTPPSPDFGPVLNVLVSGKGKLAVGGSKLMNEYKRLGPVMRYLKVLDQAGRSKRVSDAQVDAEEVAVLAGFALVSDDPHILALARVSGARLLCSKDQGLHADFTNSQIIARPRGKVYQNAAHAHLLPK